MYQLQYTEIDTAQLVRKSWETILVDPPHTIRVTCCDIQKNIYMENLLDNTKIV
jgi:hypothetical protein